jgi:hypothetical protein
MVFLQFPESILSRNYVALADRGDVTQTVRLVSQLLYNFKSFGFFI